VPEPPHYLDDLADTVANGLDDEADWYAEAMRGGSRSPFAAPVSQKQLGDVYVRTFFKQRPDGSIDWDAPNEDQRAKLMSSGGIKNYLDAAKYVMSVRPKTGVRPLDQLIEPPKSALPPLEVPPPYAGPTPLGPPPEGPPDGLMQPPLPEPALGGPPASGGGPSGAPPMPMPPPGIGP